MKGKEKVVMNVKPCLHQIILMKCHFNQEETDVFKQELEMHNLKLWTLTQKEDLDVFKKEETLVICEEQNLAVALKQEGYFVLISLNKNNEKDDFSKFSYIVMDAWQVEADFLVKVWQRFLGLPWLILETPRCYIREMTVEDLDALYEIYENPDVSKYTENLFADKDKEKQYIGDYIKNIYNYYGFGTWVIIRKKDQKLIGRAGFNYRPGFEHPELGFVFGVPYQHQGYGFEVCKSIMSICKSVYDFEVVQALTEPENISSVRLLEKLKFEKKDTIELDGKKYFYFVNMDL